MRLLSHFSMGIALATAGAIAITAIPMEVQAKKKKKQKQSKPKLSKEFGAQIGPIQAIMEGETPATAKPMLEALLAQPWTGYDQFVGGQFAVNLGSKLKEQSLQELGLNAMLNSGFTPADQVGRYTFFLGNFAYGAGRFPEAQQRLQSAYDNGFRENNIGALIAEAYFKDNKNEQGLAALDRALTDMRTAGTKAPEQWYRRGAGIALKSKAPGASAAWTYKLVEAYPSGENWRAALSVYRDAATPKLDNQQNLELMRLMRKAEAMESERDYFEYADAAGPRRLPGEVVSVLEEGIAKGAVRSNTQYSKETIGLARRSVKADKASLPASERDAMRAANGKIALATADAFLGYASYQKAVSLYQAAISKGGVDANRANIGLGIAKAGQNDWQGAKTAFAAVNGSRKPIANFWALWIDQQSTPVAPAVAEAATES